MLTLRYQCKRDNEKLKGNELINKKSLLKMNKRNLDKFKKKSFPPLTVSFRKCYNF